MPSPLIVRPTSQFATVTIGKLAELLKQPEYATLVRAASILASKAFNTVLVVSKTGNQADWNWLLNVEKRFVEIGKAEGVTFE